MKITIDDLVNLDYGSIESKIGSFIANTLESSSVDGYVIGLSGGVDSSTAAALAVKYVGSDRVFALILPDSSVTRKEDVEDAKALARDLGIEYHIIDIAPIVEVYRSSLPIYEDEDKDRIPMGNLRARIRMTLLYYYANKMNRLVLGTTDRSEWLIGYFTKYGDGAVDVEPIIVLYKTQVRRLAKHLGLPDKIAFKPSSPGLWPGHMAEKELGVSYEEVDLVLYALFDKGLKPESIPEATGVSKRVVERVLELIRINEHKRLPPHQPKIEEVIG